MKTILILFTAIFGLQELAFGQDEPLERRNSAIALELGYYSPARQSFRTNYSQSLFFGSSEVPISLGIEFDYPIARAADIYVSFKRINHALKSDRDISLTLMPATLGVHYYIPRTFIDLGSWTPYFRSGAEFYWSRFSATYILTDNSGPAPIGEISEAVNYFGYGITLGLGIERPLGGAFTISFAVNYDVNQLGFGDEGGLGNVGGLLLSAKLGITL